MEDYNNYFQNFKRLPREDEAVVLRMLLETFISRAWCLRQPYDATAMLASPSCFRRERNEQPSHPSVLVTYRFDGPADSDGRLTHGTALHCGQRRPDENSCAFAAGFVLISA